MSLIDVICVAGDVRPMKAQDILDTDPFQKVRDVLRVLLYGDPMDALGVAMFLPESVWHWINEPDEGPVQLQLPAEFLPRAKT